MPPKSRNTCLNLAEFPDHIVVFEPLQAIRGKAWANPLCTPNYLDQGTGKFLGFVIKRDGVYMHLHKPLLVLLF